MTIQDNLHSEYMNIPWLNDRGKKVCLWQEGGNCQCEEEAGKEACFAGEVESLFYLFPELANVGQHFNDFNRFSANCCIPIDTVLMSEQEFRRLCGKVLAVEGTLAHKSQNDVGPARCMSIMVIGH